MSNVFGITARAYRFYDDGTETGSTALAAENTAPTISVVSGNATCQLRYGVQESGSGSASGGTTDDYQLQYAKNGGAFANVAGASSNVRAFPSASLTDAAATTQRLSAGTGSFIAGEIDEADGIVTDWQLTADNFSELLFSIELVSADLAHGDTLTFRVLRNGAVFNTYSVTPTINVNKFTQVLDNAFELLAQQLGCVVGFAMDEASGNLTDFIGGKTGTAFGTATYGVAGAVQGKTAIDLPAGGTAYFEVADHADLDLGDGPFTLIAWAARDGDTATFETIMHKGTDAYSFGIDASDRVELGNDGVVQVAASTSTVTANGVWHMYAVTRVATGANQNKVYLDAADVTNELNTGAVMTDTTSVLRIGRYTSSANAWDGKLAYLLIFKSVLTQAQIQSLYDAALRGPLRTRLLPQLLAH